ncbi:MAG: arsenate reductase (glutaredoxin) [Bacteroidales bacterium]|nr:arsenate reductase (glutaredoxin) [Bacteroidales bacterium]
MLIIYHNPRCRTSRKGLQYLKDKGIAFEEVNYFKRPFSTQELKDIFMKLNIRPEQAVRKQENIYRQELKGKTFTDEEWIQIIMENPALLERPVVVGKYKAVIAQPPERIEELII